MINALAAQIKTAKTVYLMLMSVLTVKNLSSYSKELAELLAQITTSPTVMETVLNVKMDVNHAKEETFAPNVLTDSIYIMTHVLRTVLQDSGENVKIKFARNVMMLVLSAQIVLQRVVLDVLKDFSLMEPAVLKKITAQEVLSLTQPLENVLHALLNSAQLVSTTTLALNVYQDTKSILLEDALKPNHSSTSFHLHQD
jgi:hypothetical protein